MSGGVGHRHGLDLQWMWHRPADAALIELLSWDPPCAVGAALKKIKKKKKKKDIAAVSVKERSYVFL